jgi:hypothetical protein
MGRRASNAVVPLEEQIASLANVLWRERGCPCGSPEQDWFEAERQLSERKTEIVKVLRRARRTEHAAV